MRQQWSLIKDDALVETITNGISGGKRNLVGGRSSANHTDEWLLANNYLPHVAPTVKRFEQLGGQDIQTDKVTNEVGPKSRVEILEQIAGSVERQYDSRKENIVPQRKVVRGLVRSVLLIFKHLKYTDFASGVPLTVEDKEALAYLDLLGYRTLDLEDAEIDIIIESEGKTDEELQGLPDDYETNHGLWTEPK